MGASAVSDHSRSYRIGFSLTLGELVPNTMRSHIILSRCLKSQFWVLKDVKMRRSVMNF